MNIFIPNLACNLLIGWIILTKNIVCVKRGYEASHYVLINPRIFHILHQVIYSNNKAQKIQKIENRPQDPAYVEPPEAVTVYCVLFCSINGVNSDETKTIKMHRNKAETLFQEENTKLNPVGTVGDTSPFGVKFTC